MGRSRKNKSCWVRSTETVYNMTVDKLHSYIANGIIVHNK